MQVSCLNSLEVVILFTKMEKVGGEAVRRKVMSSILDILNQSVYKTSTLEVI